jgi:Holliday junction resolvase-like predicted endonuclease
LKAEGLWREVEGLRRELKALRQELMALRKNLPAGTPIKNVLKERGLKVFRQNPREKLLFPADISPGMKTRFYELLKRYSFRLFLRDMAKKSEGFRITDLVRYVSPEVAEQYIRFLLSVGSIEEKGKEAFRIRNGSITSFGPTLEWFVAEMFKREFASPAIYGVHFKDTRAGGDFDVIARWGRRLVYVEVKSSPPRGIEINEVSAFFSRIDDLIPDVALFFNDTQLRMRDKIVILFQEELENRYGPQAHQTHPVARLVDELFHIHDRIFIVNSRKDVVHNFGTCLNHFLRERI